MALRQRTFTGITMVAVFDDGDIDIDGVTVLKFFDGLGMP